MSELACNEQNLAAVSICEEKSNWNAQSERAAKNTRPAARKSYETAWHPYYSHMPASEDVCVCVCPSAKMNDRNFHTKPGYSVSILYTPYSLMTHARQVSKWVENYVRVTSKSSRLPFRDWTLMGLCEWGVVVVLLLRSLLASPNEMRTNRTASSRVWAPNTTEITAII